MDKLQRHHLWWPRAAYKTPVEKRFRQLPCHIIRISAAEHRLIHKLHPNGSPGGKPHREAMLKAIQLHENGECTCPPTLF